MFATRSLQRLLASPGSVVAGRQWARAAVERRALHTSVVLAAAHGKSAGRPSKTAAKQEAKHFQDLARQLARLTDKQLARLTPLVGDDVVEAVALAAKISHRNQGRQRQEGLVAKLLRESVEGEGEALVQQLQAAIESVKAGQGVIGNPAAEQQLELWMHALLAGEGEAATQVFGLAQERGIDLQQIRQLLRQAQVTEATTPQPAAEEAGGSDGSSSSEQQSAGLSSGSDSSSSGAAPVRLTAKARSARKQLRKLLQPLAAAQAGGGDDAEEEE